MNLDLDLELPVSDERAFPPPRLDNERYLEFIEFNQRLVRENGTVVQLLSTRSQPVDAEFVL